MEAIGQTTQCLGVGVQHDVAALVQRYCELIESSAFGYRDWLREIASLLPRLHAAIVSADVDDCCWEHLDLVEDLDERFDLFARLRSLLADRDSYWLEFDSASEGVDAMSGSLADDLTDIYCELKQGLRVFELNPEYAVAAWASGFDRHWGQHLIDAERHLSLLSAQARLDS